ncbi:hypothetical protein [Caballeronia sp. S22]|uniref:hypothetical protein n=1 Tax=Caballeronia sp. S22 TaxID=3137182 RepID=UPI0035313EC4
MLKNVTLTVDTYLGATIYKLKTVPSSLDLAFFDAFSQDLWTKSLNTRRRYSLVGAKFVDFALEVVKLNPNEDIPENVFKMDISCSSNTEAML